MHTVALEYLTQLKQGRARQSGQLVWTAPAEALKEAAQASQTALADYLLASFGRDHRDEVAAHRWDLDYWLTQVEQDLYADLDAYCTEAERIVLRGSAVAYLPLPNANAFAGPVPNEPEGHVIAIHLGMIWIPFLLAQALLLASESHNEAARKTYCLALDGYRINSMAESFRLWAQADAGMGDNFSANAAAVGSVVLRFVGLHELGHLVLGHVEQAQMCLLPESGQVLYATGDTLGEAGLQALEFSADRFALDHMLAHTGGPEQMWNNMLFIGAFFRFVEHLEILRGEALSPYHPPPMQRFQALYQRVEEALGPPPNDAQLWGELTLQEWRS